MMTLSDPPFMLDTNVFNDVLDGKVSLVPFGGGRVLVIGVQRDELSRTSDPERRSALLKTFEMVNPEVELASSFAFGIEGAGWDQAYWNDGSGKFEKMRARLRELDKPKKRRSMNKAEAVFLNQERDILIAETVIKVGAVLVSGDTNLRQVVEEFGGRAMDPSELTT
jgi:hypothetical protein